MRLRTALALIASVLLSSNYVYAAHATGVTVTRKYLMAFHACQGTLCNDIKNHQTYLAESDDAITWSVVPGWQPFIGSVPDVVRRGNTLYLYYVRISDGENLFVTTIDLDTGNVSSPKKVNFQGTQGHFVDPSLLVEEDGHIFLTGLYVDPPPPPPAIPTPTNPATCAPGESTCIKQILSATEVAGSNGQTFSLDSGARARITLDQTTPSASDPDLFKDKDGYTLYVSIGQSVNVYSSTTLRGEFTRLSTISRNTGGIPSGYFDIASGKRWTFVHSDKPSGSVIRFAAHSNYDQPIAEADWKTVITAQNIGLGSDWQVASPGFGLNAPGASMVVPSSTPTPNVSSSPTATMSAIPSASPSTTPVMTPSPSTPTVSISPTPAVVTRPKLLTITCVKGKTIKKVTGTAPTCPKGYLRK